MITLTEARDLLRRAMETQGRDFIYAEDGGCFYSAEAFKNHETSRAYGVRPTDPRFITGCLIGVALELAGHTAHRMRRTRVMGLWEQDVVPMTQGAATYFQEAQSHQDSGSTWGAAFDAAENWANGAEEG